MGSAATSIFSATLMKISKPFSSLPKLPYNAADFTDFANSPMFAALTSHISRTERSFGSIAFTPVCAGNASVLLAADGNIKALLT